MSDEYIDNLNKLSKNSKKVTDKLPINFKWIGIIKLILPNSKIIHCVRNPKIIVYQYIKIILLTQNLILHMI